jgi:hypothetical protein
MSNSTRRKRVGSVYQLPSKRWFARIQNGVKADGSPRVLSKAFDTEQEADAWLLAKSVELEKRPDLSAGITLKALWDVYQKGKELSNKSWATYRWYAETVWLERMGDTDISTITPSAVQAVISSLSHGNAKHAKVVLSSMLTYAVGAGMLKSNPIRGHEFSYPSAEIDTDPFDDDPFAAIEHTRDVWGIETVVRCFTMIRGLPLEPAWLCCVGAGLRVEEALALRRMDVRRLAVRGHEITQIAVHAARTSIDERKATKTAQSVRVVAVMEPFGARLWELCQGIEKRDELICPVSASNQNKRWRGYFEPPSTSKHAPRKEGFNNRGKLYGLPYLPLSKMRNTHVTIMAEAGVSDSINALIHGHTEMVERRHYLSPDATEATIAASNRLRLVV